VWVTEYDPVDQLLGVTVRSNTVAGAILKQFVYGYDKSGNRTREQIYSGGASTSVTSASHNTANQLTDVATGGSTRFKGSLNELGTVTVAGSAATVDSRTTNFVGYANTTSGTNAVTVVATDYSNNSRTNNYQLVVTNNAVAKTLTYDQNGNLSSVVTATSTNTYEWDASDRLTAINIGTNRSEFTYDGSGRRTQIVEKQNGSVVSTKKFVWCGTELCEERDSAGSSVTKRFFGRGEQISGTNYFFTADHLGSVREMTDGSGAIRARYDYDPYGRRTKVSGDLDADFAFTGHYYHSVSGMYLTMYRAYDSETGRWISRDPIAEAGGLNVYAYVANDPVNSIDRDGLFIWHLAGFAAGFAIDAAVQYASTGQWNWKQSVVSGLVGATGVGLGEVIAKNVASIAAKAALNAIGSAAIGAVGQMGLNKWEGECLWKGVGTAALAGGIFGGVGSALGDVAKAVFLFADKFGADAALKAAPLAKKLLAVSGTIVGPPSFLQHVASALGNAVAIPVANSTPLANLTLEQMLSPLEKIGKFLPPLYDSQ